ncbi:hypothetical protein [Herbidospora mongoliensis]|uniref:hypothetical protein n=1 Tax=Herbidospora mongoliensis TaxID=688067 RepID=UPI0008375B80|nr:hypothetical protein [Herbidospora mongoliensis]
MKTLDPDTARRRRSARLVATVAGGLALLPIAAGAVVLMTTWWHIATAAGLLLAVEAAAAAALIQLLDLARVPYVPARVREMNALQTAHDEALLLAEKEARRAGKEARRADMAAACRESEAAEADLMIGNLRTALSAARAVPEPGPAVPDGPEHRVRKRLAMPRRTTAAPERVPSIRDLKAKLGVGQAKAARVQAVLADVAA